MQNMVEFKLRSWSMNDLDALVLNANNINIAKFMTDAFPNPYSRENGIQFIRFATKDDPIHIFAIDINGEASGGIGIHPQDDIHRMNAELGYWLAEHQWGKGIISRAIPQVVDFAFKTYNINRIFARPFGNNAASQRVLEKCGFSLEARLEKTLIKMDELQDEMIYSIRRKEN
jgi:RimJ/RimL family protein N-acetyltransferase